MQDKQIQSLIFWVYYAKGLLYSSLQKYKEVIKPLDSSLDFENYFHLLSNNTKLLKKELQNHRQFFDSTSKAISGKIRNSNELSTKGNAQQSLDKYGQVIEYLTSLIDSEANKISATVPNFAIMFDIPLSDNDSQNFRLQCGHAHYNKALSQIALQEQEEALKSLHISNKLLPEFYPSYIAKAEIYKEQREFMKAVVQYDMAIRLEENNPDSYFNRSVLLFELGKTELAKEDFAKWQSLKQEN